MYVHVLAVVGQQVGSVVPLSSLEESPFVSGLIMYMYTYLVHETFYPCWFHLTPDIHVRTCIQVFQ